MDLPDGRNVRAQVLGTGMATLGVGNIKEQRTLDFDRDGRSVKMI